MQCDQEVRITAVTDDTMIDGAINRNGNAKRVFGIVKETDQPINQRIK